MKTIRQNVSAMWEESSKSQRESLLEGLGFNKSWASIDSIDEIQERGGGMVIRDLMKLWEKGFGK